MTLELAVVARERQRQHEDNYVGAPLLDTRESVLNSASPDQFAIIVSSASKAAGVVNADLDMGNDWGLEGHVGVDGVNTVTVKCWLYQF